MEMECMSAPVCYGEEEQLQQALFALHQVFGSLELKLYDKYKEVISCNSKTNLQT